MNEEEEEEEKCAGQQKFQEID